MLHGEHGLLLTLSIDHLFDRGFIGFEGNGNVIISPVAHRPSLEWMGIEMPDTLNVGSFTVAQRHFFGVSPVHGAAEVGGFPVGGRSDPSGPDPSPRAILQA